MKKNLRIHLISLALLLICILLDMAWGAVKIPITDILAAIFTKQNLRNEWQIIILNYRIPKVITAMLAGAALSVSGLQMQTVFRNPLAGPYVLGVTSGATLGIAIFYMGFTLFFSPTFLYRYELFGVLTMAIVGASLMLALIVSVTLKIKNIVIVLIVGILFGNIASSIINILQFASDEKLLKSFIVWTMGSVSNVSSENLPVFALTILLGLVASFATVKVLNALLVGQNYAQTIGVDLKRSRTYIFLATSVLSGGVTAFCGPIGFVGIVVPHICRSLLKTTNQLQLLISCILIGAIFLILSDLLTQMPFTSKIIPINSITSFLGIPVVIYIIFRNKRMKDFS